MNALFTLILACLIVFIPRTGMAHKKLIGVLVTLQKRFMRYIRLTIDYIRLPKQ